MQDRNGVEFHKEKKYGYVAQQLYHMNPSNKGQVCNARSGLKMSGVRIEKATMGSLVSLNLFCMSSEMYSSSSYDNSICCW